MHYMHTNADYTDRLNKDDAGRSFAPTYVLSQGLGDSIYASTVVMSFFPVESESFLLYF